MKSIFSILNFFQSQRWKLKSRHYLRYGKIIDILCLSACAQERQYTKILFGFRRFRIGGDKFMGNKFFFDSRSLLPTRADTHQFFKRVDIRLNAYR
jgi:hypothetical protein